MGATVLMLARISSAGEAGAVHVSALLSPSVSELPVSVSSAGFCSPQSLLSSIGVAPSAEATASDDTIFTFQLCMHASFAPAGAAVAEAEVHAVFAGSLREQAVAGSHPCNVQTTARVQAVGSRCTECCQGHEIIRGSLHLSKRCRCLTALTKADSRHSAGQTAGSPRHIARALCVALHAAVSNGALLSHIYSPPHVKDVQGHDGYS